MLVGGIILIVVIVLVVFMYNSLIGLKNSVKESKAAIDTFFQKRYDLIPNLVKVVKQYVSHERGTLESVVNLRNNLTGNQDMTSERFEKENIISGTMKSIFALSENYPNLKADSQFTQLQNEWASVESDLQGARRAYNSAIKLLNNKKEMFPSNIIAGMMTIEQYDMFEADDIAKSPLDADKLRK